MDEFQNHYQLKIMVIQSHILQKGYIF